MKIIVNESVSLEDVDNLRALEVVSDLSPEMVSERLSAAGLGKVSGEHAWLLTDELAARGAAATSDPDWAKGYAAMLDYARSKDWVDETTGAVRAHITAAS